MISSKCMTFGDKMFELRSRRGFSQETFASIVGVSRQVVSTWEANKAQPNASKFTAISNALGVKIEFMFDTNRSLADIRVEDCLDIEDSVCSDILRENAIQEELTQQKQVAKECVNESCGQCCAYIEYLERRRKARNKLIKKIAIGVIISAIVLGIALIVFDVVTAPPHYEGQIATAVESHTWNFSPENIGWIIFSVAIGIGVIVGIVMLCKYIKRKISNKRANGENK